MIYENSKDRKQRIEYIVVRFYFFILIVVPIIGLFLKKLSLDVAIIDYLDELALVFAFPLCLSGFAYLRRTRSGKIILTLFFFYISVGVFSALNGGVDLVQLLFQTVLELKLIIIISLFFGLNKGQLIYFVNAYVKFIKIALVFSAPLVIWQFADSESYHAAFPAAADKVTFNFFESIRLQRASGIFWFSGQLAIFAGIATCIFFFRFATTKSRFSVAWLALSTVLLISSFSRLEIASTLVAITLTYILYFRKNRFVLAFAGVVILPFLYLVFKSVFLHVIYEYNIVNIEESDAARVVFYVSSVILAAEYFPLGAGFGVFGGKAAAVYGSEIYSRLNFEQYWWYNQQVYLTDTFWPHILGEAGVFGLFFMIFVFVFLWKFIFTSASQLLNMLRLGVKQSFVVYSSSAIYLVLLFNSLASPNYYEIISFLPCMLFIAYAERRFGVS